MKTPESIKKAVKKHQAKLDTITIHAPKGSKERWRSHAKAQGKSMTAYIIELIEADLKKTESAKQKIFSEMPSDHPEAVKSTQ